jgi:hypothetical protein
MRAMTKTATEIRIQNGTVWPFWEISKTIPVIPMPTKPTQRKSRMVSTKALVKRRGNSQQWLDLQFRTSVDHEYQHLTMMRYRHSLNIFSTSAGVSVEKPVNLPFGAQDFFASR